MSIDSIKKNFRKLVMTSIVQSTEVGTLGKKIPGSLPGTPPVFDVRGRPGYKYVTRRDQTVIEALLKGSVEEVENYPVEFREENGTYVILGRSVHPSLPIVLPTPPLTEIPAHASSHLEDGTDPLATVTPIANGIPQAGLDGFLDIGWLDPDDLPPGVVAEVTEAAEQTVLEDTNVIPAIDDGVLKWVSWATIKTALTSLFDTLYAAIGHDHDGDYALIGHDHDGVYSLITHDHDSDYVALTGDQNVGGVKTFTNGVKSPAIEVTDGGEMLLSDPDVTHGMTALLSTNVYGKLNIISPTEGGLDLWGVSEGDNIGLRLIGIIGSNTPTATTPAFIMRGDKRSASGLGNTALAAGETVFVIDNNANRLFRIMGNGDVILNNGATLTVETLKAVDATGLILQDDGGNIGLSVLDGGNVVVYPNLFVGVTSNLRSVSLPGSKLIVEQITTDVVAQFWQNTADALGARLVIGKTRGTALGSNAALVTGDVIGLIEFWGGDGSGPITPGRGAMIYAQVNGSVSNNDIPSDLVLATAADGSGVTTDRMRILANGNVGIGTATPQGAVHVHDGVSGFLKVTKTAIIGAAQTIIPDGAGDVTKALTGSYILSESGGGAVANFLTMLPSDVLDIVVGGYTLRLTLSAGGALTAIRQAGATSGTLTLDICWQ